MVAGDVVGHEVDEQAHPALGQRGPGGSQTLAATEAAVGPVAADAVGRADHVGFGEVGQCGAEAGQLVRRS